MKILTVIPELGVGGSEVVAVTAATAAAARGHDAVVASTPGYRVAQLDAAGVRHVPLSLVGRNPAELARSLARLRALDRPGLRPDVVHAHNPKASALARLAFGGRVPILTTLHGVSEGERRLTTRVLRRVSDRVAVVSPHLGRQLEEHGFPAERIEVVRTTLEPLPAYDRDRARTELGLAPDAVVGLCLARMVDQKRHDLLVEAWASVRGGATLLLAGDGPKRPEIAAAITRHGLDDDVHQLGERSDVPRLIAASDFLVLSTDWEGLPISMLESLAAGLPVVASRVDGLVEHFDGAVHFVAPGSAAALAAALEQVVDEPSLRADLAARGRALSAERFSASAMVDQYHDIYARLTGSPAGRPALAGGRR